MTDNTAAPSGTDFGFDDPADNAIAHSIASKDPIRDIAGPVSLIGGDNIRTPATVPLSALSPAMQAPIREKLKSVPASTRAATEAELVADALRTNSIGLRITGGGGANADPYWRESLDQANEERQLQQNIWRIETELSDVERWDVETDPATGAQTPKAVERIQGERRRGMEAERANLQAQLGDLNGRGGQLKLKKAMQKAVEAHKEIERQLAEDAEAKERGDALNREARINTRAETYAKHRRHNF